MKVLRKIPDVFGLCSAVLIVAVWVLLTAELISRNIFSSPILGVSEISVYLYVTAAYFGFSFTQKEKGHICVDLLYENLPAGAKRVVSLISYLLCDALFVFFTYFIWNGFAKSWAIKEIQLSAMKMPVYVLKFTIAVGVTVMFLQLIIDTVDAVRALKGNDASGNIKEEIV